MPPNQPLEPTPTNNAEIDKALKEFEAASGAGTIPEAEQPHIIKGVIVPQTADKPTDINDTEGVKFEAPTYGAIKYVKQTDTPKMVQAVIKYSGGSIKNQKQAEWLLFGFVIVAIGISIYLFFGTGSKSNPSTPEMIQKMENAQKPIHP
jgi:hypothetical protein